MERELKESQIQQQIIGYLSFYARKHKFIYFAPMNEGFKMIMTMFKVPPKTVAIIMNFLMKMGFLPGVTDIIIGHNGKMYCMELKTKTTGIDRIFSLDHRDRIIISWSLNSPYIVAHEEHLAPSLEQRLKAAKRCQEEGFVTGFHFDPLIIHKDWKVNYRKTVDLMDKYLDPNKIIWISFGLPGGWGI